MLALIDQVYFVIFGVMIFSSVLWLLVYVKNRREVHTDPQASYEPEVTFLIPAYNEEEHIAESIESLLNQTYPSEKLEIIAINDGSTDSTLEIMKEYEDRIQIIDKENSGKASSMNYALERVETEVVGCLDGDSFADPEMVENLVRYMDDEAVRGVTPAMKVRNPETWVQEVIWAEYVYQIFLRKLFSLFDSQYVMPGPGSIYETKLLKELGGWDEETHTEDMEVAFRMHQAGVERKEPVRIENSTNAYVDTISPPTLKGLHRQRVRWYRGYIENTIKYRGMMFNRDYGNLGYLLLPLNVVWTLLVVFILSHFAFTFLQSIIDAFRTYILVGFMPPSLGFSIQSISMFHIFYAWFLIIGVANILLSIKTAEEELKLWQRKTHYLLYLWIYSFLYAWFWVAAVFEEIRGVGFKW